MINSCTLAAHGAGLTNELFLPDGVVMVHVDLIGLEWAGATYYGNPARAMDVHYLRYQIEPDESSLFKIFGRNHTVITDPRSIDDPLGKEAYLNGQNVRINLARYSLCSGCLAVLTKKGTFKLILIPAEHASTQICLVSKDCSIA
ncbi:Glycosyltransferase family 61 protein [Forsythia ovata]|uniref:Glycosyltransferase family 61 protein n=1 Tax=Forsythia ovata TaxID=205694 RepID=A0ABD1RL93_9LAMI